jgi:opacity protein-like surface antigen
LVVGVILGAVLTMGAGRAHAEETDPHPVGVGYKIGNGLGVIGADVLLRLIPHVVFDLQANYLSLSETVSGVNQSVTGYGLAPTVQFQLKPIGHTPYLGIGMVYAHESLNDVTASATGLLVNAGYEWRFASGVGVLVGGGIADVGQISATDGITTIKQTGGVLFNLKVGVRYYF